MIKIENVVLPSPEQIEFTIQGMRNPKNSWDKSDSGVCLETLPYHSYYENRNDYKKNIDAGFVLGENDRSLMKSLAKAGTEHRKYMRMMPIYARITAPLYWWKEADTYKIGTVSNSCSTMHKISAKKFQLEDFSHEHLTHMDSTHMDENEDALNALQVIINALNYNREKYLEIKDKRYWWQMIQLLPSSYNQTRNIMFNYEVLTNIYKQRQNHKLDEWIKFCNWIETLPYSNLITNKESEN